MKGRIHTSGEPFISFSRERGRHSIDPKEGLKSNKPLDYNVGRRTFGEVRLGVVAFEDDLNKVLEHLRNLLKTHEPAARTAGIAYPGFESVYGDLKLRIPSDVSNDPVQAVSNEEIESTKKSKEPFDALVNLYSRKLEALESRKEFGVTVVEIPAILQPFFKYGSDRRDLRAALKALGVRKRMYTQLLLGESLDYSQPGFDLSDNMWNLSLGLYVKAGGIPWRLEEGNEGTCFVGTSFATKHGDRQLILIGLAEVFDEFGESVTIKVVEDAYSSDRGLHLSVTKMRDLIQLAISGYVESKGANPERLVVHKTTFFDDMELRGAQSAIPKGTASDLVHVQFRTARRLIASGGYPPNRGTFWETNDESGLLYTTGYVSSLGTYPGMGTPHPLQITRHSGDTPITSIAKEILGLTKMNWDSAALMNREPVTINYSRRVSDVLKEGVTPEQTLKDFRYYV